MYSVFFKNKGWPLTSRKQQTLVSHVVVEIQWMEDLQMCFPIMQQPQSLRYKYIIFKLIRVNLMIIIIMYLKN